MPALIKSGLPCDSFIFEGFLPAKAGQRRSRISELRSIPGTLIVFEAAHRLGTVLSELADGLGSREAAVCRELTKLHEEVAHGQLAALARDFAAEGKARGEMVIVIAPPRQQPETSTRDIDAMLREALERLSLKEAVAEVAAVTGQPRRSVYQRALALIKEHEFGR